MNRFTSGMRKIQSGSKNDLLRHEAAYKKSAGKRLMPKPKALASPAAVKPNQPIAP